MRLTDFCSAIEEAAGRLPGKAAIVDAAGSLSYTALARGADAIAHGLLRRGLERGTPVGILLPAGSSYVQAFLGTARAGGAPMPLDTGAPPDRPRRLLARSGCRLVIDCQLAAEMEEESAAGGELPRPRPEDPCYVMSTSGSTGEPKAILGCHRGLSHFLRWEIGELGLDESVRASALAPTTFDVSLRDMLIPLCAGGTLYIPTGEVRTRPRSLLAWLAESGITLMHIVPTLFRLLLAELESGDAARPDSLRHILLAGEPLYGSDVARWRAVMGSDAELVNLYGPTETTLAKAFFRIGDRELEPNRAVPIGDPLPNTALLVLDGDRLCGIGEIGEIHIKTPYRTLGYLNDPEQTAAVFIDNPLNPGQGDVVYRTGDLGRYLPGRQVECLGRLDNQIKINGIRIEPAEIESVVRRLEGIADTVVVGHRTAAQQMSLACYYTQKDTAHPVTVETLRAHLSSSLPASLIPGFFVEMRELPYTVSGKIARKALPKPEELLYERRPYRAPSNPVEEKLAAIWGQVLGLSRVGVAHPFLELGGDSLKAIRATSAIYRELGVEIGLKELFEQGTVEALAHLVTGSRRATAAPIPALPPAPDYPVSHAQRRLWTLDQMEIDSVAYNLPLAFRVTGPLDAGRLRNALDRLVERHEALRTTFVMVGQELRQRIVEIPATPLPVVEVPTEEALERRVEEERARPFDLARGPLFRAQLLRRDADDHVLLFNIHHIICDVWSLVVMVRELRALYADPAADLPPLRLQYRDFAAWQNASLVDGGLEAERRYWLGRLSGELPVLELPTDFPRPPVQTFRGATLHRGLGSEVTEGLTRLGVSLEASLFMLLQSLTKVLLHRLTGQRDLVVGSPVVGRQHPDLEEQAGLYVNTLALRDLVDPEMAFGELVERVRQTTREATAHQAYPFDVLVDELALERDMSHSPLFDVMVVLQEEDPEPFSLAGVQVSPFGRETAWNFSRFDMVLHFMRQDGELVLDLNYNTDLFLPERAARVAAQLEELARSVLAAPERAVGDLDLLPPAERALLESFGRGVPRPLAGETIVELFEARVALSPAATALVHGSRSLTYRELNEEANRLAHFLLAQGGIERGDRVVVAAGRSLQSLVALLGILKAGAVYVPVDPALPRRRLLDLLEDSGCRWALTDGEPPDMPAPWLRIADALVHWRHDPGVPLTGRDPAYLIYTSGSTGRPKGVLVEHAGFVNMSLCQIEVFGQGAGDRVLQFASSSFDASLAETFSALLCGGTLVLVDRETIEHPADFLSYVAEQAITVVTLPPAYLSALGRPPLPGVRVLITAGEAAQVGDALYYSRTRDCFNAYGPTETSVCASMYRLDPRRSYPSSVPVGVPVANTSVLVLDERLNLLPVGVPGEICVAGPGLARGYHRRPDATAARFVPHPFRDGRAGERLYRTGDRGRWASDGNLEFLGRLDDQVKVHGHRVELGGIESALRACDGVGDVFATYVAEGGGLAAYYTPPRRVELWPSVAEFLVYDDVLYGSMARDEQRNRLYRGAFQERLRGSTVVEVGPGAELVLSRLALEAGARHVYAIELLRETWERARARIDELGLGDRITLLHGDATQVELDTRVDWCISEIVGGIGGSEGAAFILNAARRFLRRPEAMLPRRSVTRLAAVDLPEERLQQGFSEIAAHYVRRIFDETGGPFDLRLCVKNLPPESLLTGAGVLEDLDFTHEVALEADHDTRLTVTREGNLSGLLAWLNLHVDETRVLDILGQEASWLPVYLPVFSEPVEVRPGDHLDLTVSRRLSATGIHPDYHLRGRLYRPGRRDMDVRLDAWHRARSFRGTPFYERLFAGGDVPIARGVTAEELRGSLLERLPRYEVPTYLVRMDRLPLTSSGKVDRRALPDPLPRREPSSPAAPVAAGLEETIARAWRAVLGGPVGPDDNFFTLGGDSIKAIRIVSLLHEDVVRLEVRDLFSHPTVRRCATVARYGRASVPQGPVTGELMPTPIQLWFFDRFRLAPHHFNQSVVLWAGERLDLEALRTALDAVQRHHDALRLRFRPEEGGWRGHFAAVGSPVWLEELAGSEESWREKAGRIQAEFRLDGESPLMRTVLIHLPERDALWVLCHHLVVDAASWAILIEDLETAYRAALAHEKIRLPARTSSYQDFATALVDWAASSDLTAERAHWQAVCSLPQDTLPGGTVPAGEAAKWATSEISLAPEQTSELIGGARRACDVGAAEVLLAALGLAVRRWGGVKRCLVDVEAHGRTVPFAGLDVSRTVGWFTTFFPVLLEATDGEAAGDTLRRVREALREVPSGGTGYGALTRLAPDPLPEARPEVGFNYLGELSGSPRAGGLFSVDWDAPGPSLSPEAEPVHALDVLGAVLDGRLVVSLTWDSRRVSSESARALLEEMRECLIRFVEHFASVQAPAAPPEFTFQGLSPEQLDQILSDLGALRAGSGAERERTHQPGSLEP